MSFSWSYSPSPVGLLPANDLSDVADHNAARDNLGVVRPVYAVAVLDTTLSGEQSIDSVMTSTSLVLLTNQSNTTQNGPWLTAASGWSRPDWFVAGQLYSGGTLLHVTNGTVYAGSHWFAPGNITVNTTNQSWSQLGALDSDLVSWALITRAVGFDTFVATPSGANLAALLTSPLPVSKGGTGLVNLTPLSVYASGTAYSVTDASALVDFGTIDPTLVISGAGNWVLFCRVHFKYNAATFAANQTLTAKLRRTNNSAADLTDSLCTTTLRILTIESDNVGMSILPPVIYNTAAVDDSISLYAHLSALPGAGSVDCTEACIIALRISA